MRQLLFSLCLFHRGSQLVVLCCCKNEATVQILSRSSVFHVSWSRKQVCTQKSMVHMAFTVVGIPFARSLLVWYGMVLPMYSTPSPDVTCVGINRKFCGRDFLEPASRIRRECHSAEAQQPTQKTYRESAWIKCWLDKMPWDWNRVWAKVFTINQLLCVALKLSFLIHSDIVVITTMKTTFLFHLLLCLFATATAKSDGVSGDAKPHASLIWCYYLFW